MSVLGRQRHHQDLMMALSRKFFSKPSKGTIILLLQKMMAELTATYIIMFLGCGSAFIDKRINITHVGVAFTWAAVIVAMGYTFGHVSGCHMNPAVTIGFAAARKFPWKEVPFYVFAQTTGSTLACLMLLWLFSGEPTYVMLALPGGPNPVSNLQAAAWEIIISSILMLVIRSATEDPRAFKKLGGIAVGGTIFSIIIVAGRISGASMNPARSLGPAIVTNNFNKIWIYLISPVIGTVFGSTLYNFLWMPMKQDGKDNSVSQGVSHGKDGTTMQTTIMSSGNMMEMV